MKKDLQTVLLNFKDKVREFECELLTKENKVYELYMTFLCYCKDEIASLNELYENNCLSNIENQIFFFKNLKPEIVSTFSYYQERIQIDRDIKKFTEEEKKRYLSKKIKTLNKLFSKNTEFYTYHELGLTNNDCHYFSECDMNEELYKIRPELCMSIQHYFSRKDTLLADFLKQEKLIKYCNNIAQKKTNGQLILPLFQENLNWTDSNTSLVEIAVALKEIKAINNGDVSIKEIVLGLKSLFNVDGITDVYSYTKDIKQRVKDPTKFIDKMKLGLENYLVKDLE